MTCADWLIETEFNLPYPQALEKMQKAALTVKQNPQLKYLMICSHPHCFTYGRGLQRKTNEDLCDLSLEQKKNLPFELYQVSRGGGLTFHYPGQIIIYPVLNFNQMKKSLARLMVDLLKMSGEILQEQGLIASFDYRQQLLGLWSEGKKIASVGMNLERFVSQHGMALNFFQDSAFEQVMSQLSPCGISGQNYHSVQHFFSELSEQHREQFCQLWIEKFKNYLSSISTSTVSG